MLKHNYGLTPKEDALISFLVDKEVDFVPLFYNSAIPIKELVDFPQFRLCYLIAICKID